MPYRTIGHGNFICYFFSPLHAERLERILCHKRVSGTSSYQDAFEKGKNNNNNGNDLRKEEKNEEDY